MNQDSPTPSTVQNSGGSDAVSGITSNTRTPEGGSAPTGSRHSTRTTDRQPSGGRDNRAWGTTGRNNFNNLSQISSGDSNTRGENEVF